MSAPAREGAITRLGTIVLASVDEVGRFALLAIQTPGGLVRRGFRMRDVWVQFESVAARSTTIVSITALFTGMVLALQSSATLDAFGARPYVGRLVCISMVRELGPVLAGLMVAGRVGASMAAELGTMKVTEQIDALITLATNPVKYLVVPRVVAATIVLPVLVVFADLLGIVGGYFVSVYLMGANPYVYMSKTYQYLEFKDIYTGLVKASVFGMLIALISCHHGFVAQGGAEGVGRATTRAVVASSMMVLISDYFMTSFMF